MVVGEHEHLGLAGEATERRRMQDPVAIALEAGAEWVGRLGDGPPARATGARGPGGKGGVLGGLARLAVEHGDLAESDVILVGEAQRRPDTVAVHRRGPTHVAIGRSRFVGVVVGRGRGVHATTLRRGCDRHTRPGPGS